MKENVKPLQAEKLLLDPKVKEAKKLLSEAVLNHQKSLIKVKPADPKRKISYKALIQNLSDMRGASLYYPYLGSGIGNGVFVELLDGSVKYDLITGIGVHALGHSHLSLVKDGIDAAISNTIMQGNLQQNKETLDLSSLLIKASGLDHCFLTSSGVMANENAAKMFFQKKYPAYRVLAFHRSFCGRSLFFSQVTDKPSFRKGLPRNVFVDYVPFYEENDPKFSLDHSLAILRSHLKRYPNEHAFMIFELVQGEGGFYPGSEKFFKGLMGELKEHGIGILVDEVQTFGRTSELFAFQHFHLEKYVDMVSIGKLSQVCATLFKKEWVPEPGLISQTFTSSTFAIKASNTIIQTLLDQDYFGPKGKIEKLHISFVKRLKELSLKKPHLIQGPFGIGCMIGFTPLQGDQKKVQAFVKKLFDSGIISFVAGQNPTRVRFLLPVGAIQEKDIDPIIQILETVLDRFEES